MKFVLVALALISSAHASYYATFCSNASGSIRWESGHNSNTATIRYFEDVALERKVDLNKLDIKEVRLTTLKDESNCSHNMYQAKKVYVSHVVITPSADFPNVLDFTGEEPKIEADVLCEYHMNSRAQCN